MSESLSVYILDAATDKVIKKLEFTDPRREFESRFYSKKGSKGLKLRFCFRSILQDQSLRTKLRLIERDGRVCAYCLKTRKCKQLTIDHVIPKSRGGADDISNYVLACKGCNNAKADRTPEEWSRDVLSRFTSSEKTTSTSLAKKTNIVFDLAYHMERLQGPKLALAIEYTKVANELRYGFASRKPGSS